MQTLLLISLSAFDFEPTLLLERGIDNAEKWRVDELWVFELEVKHLRDVADRNFHRVLSESLAKADARPTRKWSHCVGMSLLAVWRQVKRARAVVTFGKELEWSLPIDGV